MEYLYNWSKISRIVLIIGTIEKPNRPSLKTIFLRLRKTLLLLYLFWDQNLYCIISFYKLAKRDYKVGQPFWIKISNNQSVDIWRIFGWCKGNTCYARKIFMYKVLRLCERYFWCTQKLNNIVGEKQTWARKPH